MDTHKVLGVAHCVQTLLSQSFHIYIYIYIDIYYIYRYGSYDRVESTLCRVKESICAFNPLRSERAPLDSMHPAQPL